jgi:hypothetical protein
MKKGVKNGVHLIFIFLLFLDHLISFRCAHHVFLNLVYVYLLHTIDHEFSSKQEAKLQTKEGNHLCTYSGFLETVLQND